MSSKPQPQPLSAFAAGFPRALGGKYVLLQEIGRGGMAAVHLAVTGGIGAHRACAVKTVAYRPGERDAELLTKRFLEEAAAVTRLSHESLVYVFDAGIVDRQLYLAMEFIEGRTLADLMAWSRKHRKPLPLGVVLSITIEVLNGLAYVHRHRLVHRDVSPSNVMVAVSGAVKLLDFGLARSTENAQHTGLGMKLGKAGYAAPEQMLGGTADARSDLYSVGVMLWELLAGRSMTPADGLRPRDIAFVSPSKFEASAPPELDESLRLALAASPEDRFATAEDFAADLSRYLAPADHRKQLRQFVEANFGEQLSQEKLHRESLVLLAVQHAAEPALDPKSVGPMSAPADYVGTVLDGRYELVRLVGSGSMGAVYEGKHKGIGRKVPIKIPFLHGSADLKERFIREARATNRINDPHVVDITDAGETPQGDAYVVMDFLEGRDLEKWNAERKIWPPDEAVDVVVQIVRGLEAAHEAGVVESVDSAFVARVDASITEKAPAICSYSLNVVGEKNESVYAVPRTVEDAICSLPWMKSEVERQLKVACDIATSIVTRQMLNTAIPAPTNVPSEVAVIVSPPLPAPEPSHVKVYTGWGLVAGGTLVALLGAQLWAADGDSIGPDRVANTSGGPAVLGLGIAAALAGGLLIGGVF